MTSVGLLTPLSVPARTAGRVAPGGSNHCPLPIATPKRSQRREVGWLPRTTGREGDIFHAGARSCFIGVYPR